jgi:hypothetical protein
VETASTEPADTIGLMELRTLVEGLARPEIVGGSD